MKRILSILLTLAMLLALSGGAFAADNLDPASDGGLYGNKDYTAEEALSFTYAGVGMSEEVQDFSHCDPIISLVEDKFNFRFEEAVSLGWGNWNESMRVWINSGDMPDVMFYSGNYQDMKTFAEQGLIRDMGDLNAFAEKYPALQSVLDSTGISQQYVERFGGLYCLPRSIYSNMPTNPLVGHQILTFRADWLKQLGFEIKDAYTVDEIIEIGATMAAATDLPDAIPGRTFGLDGTNISYVGAPFMLPYNLYCDTFVYDADKGEYVWGPTLEGTVEGLAKWREAWEKGAVHPEFYITRDPANNLTSGLCGINYDCGTGMCCFSWLTTFLNAEGHTADMLCYAASVGNDGLTYCGETTNYWGYTIFNPDLADDKLNRYLEMLDWLSTDCGQYLLRLGLYGSDWDRDENGEMRILREARPDGSYPAINSIYKSLPNFMENMTVCTDGFSLIDPALPVELREAVSKTFATKQQGVFRYIDWDLQLFSGAYYDKFTGFDYWSEYAALVVADGDLQANYENWLNTNAPMVQNVLDELNANIKK